MALNNQRIPEHPRLNLPLASLRVKRCDDGIWRVFDRLRDKFVALTPEEWVRQHFVEYLIVNLGYPAALLANEVALSLNSTRRRCDTVLFSKASSLNVMTPAENSSAFTLGNLRPLAIVEYKAPEIEITQKVFDQIARYNLVMGAPVLIVSNGLRHFCCLMSNGAYSFLKEIPRYDDLLRIVGTLKSQLTTPSP